MIQLIFDSAIAVIKRALKKKLGIGTVAMMSRSATSEGEDEPGSVDLPKQGHERASTHGGSSQALPGGGR